MTMFAVGLLGSLVAAPLLQLLGWQSLNPFLLPWLAVAAAALSGFGMVRARLATR
jgi:hypothetical protein